jgi:hypothetical protein
MSEFVASFRSVSKSHGLDIISIAEWKRTKDEKTGK